MLEYWYIERGLLDQILTSETNPAIKLRVVQFWSEIILVISNWTRAALSFKFEITRVILDQIALHSVQLPLQITPKCIKLASVHFM